jgi:AraC-like DNA-binding protein
MTATPPIIAGTPEGAPDVLSEILRGVRLSGSVFLDGRFCEPFGVVSPPRWDDFGPMAHLRHVSVFHLIAHGHCKLEIADGSVHDVRAGDVLLLPFTAAHRFWCGDDPEFAYAPDLVKPGPIPGVEVVRHGGPGGDEARFVCGFLESAELLAAPLFRSLPPLIIERTAEDAVSDLLTTTVKEIIQRIDSADPSVSYLLSRLMELLFLEVLRRQAARLPPDAKGMLAAASDAVVSRALSLLHNAPARRWTVETLAQEAGASRTILTERFSRLIGKSPMEYLTHWRIQLAAERLKTGNQRLAQISHEAGYESEAAFSRAFRRIMGASPGAWRNV